MFNNISNADLFLHNDCEDFNPFTESSTHDDIQDLFELDLFGKPQKTLGQQMFENELFGSLEELSQQKEDPKVPETQSTSKNTATKLSYAGHGAENSTLGTTTNFSSFKDFPEASAPQEKPQREIFLLSKLKKRPPRRNSFDLGDFREPDENIFIENLSSPKSEKKTSQVSSKPNFSLNKLSLSTLYNKIVDDAHVTNAQLSTLSETESEILQMMLSLRFSNGKKQQESVEPLLKDLNLLNNLLGSTKIIKKRNEELLKKYFKGVLKIMLEKWTEESNLKPGSDQKANFIAHFFGSSPGPFAKIFKCIQMTRQKYLQLFKEYPLFREAFLEASPQFISSFEEERQIKTENLISNIGQEIMVGKKNQMGLRTPWSIREAQLAQNTMLQLVQNTSC